MINVLKKQRYAQVLTGFFLFLTCWWLLLRATTVPEDINNQIFAAVYGAVALIGALGGIMAARKWGFTRSLMGRAMLMFSLGLLAQEFGQLSYSYYIYFLKIEVPYPSVGDIGYFGSIPFYIYGVLLFAKASGVTVTLKSISNQLKAVIVPLGMLVFSYIVFLKGYEFDFSQPLTVFLDFGYPLGQAIYVSLAFLTYLLSRKILGGVMKNKILFILFALTVQYCADYMFLYQAAKGGWFAGGLNDYIYLISYYLMSMGLLQMRLSNIKDQLN